MPWSAKELAAQKLPENIPALVPMDLAMVPGMWRWPSAGEPQPIVDKRAKAPAHVTVSQPREYNKVYGYPAFTWLSADRGPGPVTILSGFETEAACIAPDPTRDVTDTKYVAPSASVDVLYVREAVARGNAFLIQISLGSELRGYMILKYVDSFCRGVGRVLAPNEWHIQIVATAPKTGILEEPKMFMPLLDVAKRVAIAYGGVELTLDSMNYFVAHTESVDEARELCGKKKGFDVTSYYERFKFERYEHAVPKSIKMSEKLEDGSVPMSLSLVG